VPKQAVHPLQALSRRYTVLFIVLIPEANKKAAATATAPGPKKPENSEPPTRPDDYNGHLWEKQDEF
jgi:hypothetical protein